MLHWGRIFLKQLYNLDLKFNKNLPKKGRIYQSSFTYKNYYTGMRTEINKKRGRPSESSEEA